MSSEDAVGLPGAKVVFSACCSLHFPESGQSTPAGTLLAGLRETSAVLPLGAPPPSLGLAVALAAGAGAVLGGHFLQSQPPFIPCSRVHDAGADADIRGWHRRGTHGRPLWPPAWMVHRHTVHGCLLWPPAWTEYRHGIRGCPLWLPVDGAQGLM